jgi:hypothetical protein
VAVTVDWYKALRQIVPPQDGDDPLRIRKATVDAVNSDGTLDIILSGVTIPDVTRIAGTDVADGDEVQVLVHRGSLLVLGTVASANTVDLAALKRNIAMLSVVGTTSGNDETTSSTLVNMAGTGAVTSFSYTKLYSASLTRVKAHMAASFTAITNNTLAEFALRIDGTDYVMCSSAPGATNYAYPSGDRFITGIAANTYTVQARWRRASGTGTARRDVNTWLSVVLEEVPV